MGVWAEEGGRNLTGLDVGTGTQGLLEDLRVGVLPYTILSKDQAWPSILMWGAGSLWGSSNHRSQLLAFTNILFLLLIILHQRSICLPQLVPSRWDQQVAQQ